MSRGFVWMTVAAFAGSILVVGAGCKDEKAERAKERKERRRDKREKKEALLQKTSEAIDRLDMIYKSASNYYTTPMVTKGTGTKIDCQFPANQGMTPDVTRKKCCGGVNDRDGDDRCDVNISQWATPTWSALNFQMNDQHYFGYSFTSRGTLSAAKFTAAAHADLDCDGVLSTFERYGYGDETASHAECSMKGSSAFYKNKPSE